MPVQNHQSQLFKNGSVAAVISQVVCRDFSSGYPRFLSALRVASLMLILSNTGFAQISRALETYQKQYESLEADFHDNLKQLAQSCQKDQQLDGVQAITKLLNETQNFDPQATPLPRALRAEIPLNLPAAERTWRLKLRNLQDEQAKDLFVFSRKVLHAGFPSYAYDRILETAFHNSDHRSVRQILGYVRNGNEWMTPFEKEMHNRKRQWHPKYGWLPASHVARYEKGERYVNGRWKSAAQEAEIRRDFRNAWEIKTEHFKIKTNHSLEMGVKIATEMENFHRYFHQTFVGFFKTPDQLKKLFEGARNPFLKRNQNTQHVMHYYSTREEYLQRLQKEIPQIALTHGIYLFGDRISHFYHRPEAQGDLGTLYHEATHQLFYETGSSRTSRQVGEKNHFWAIEGIACYMESFEKNDDGYRAGNPNHIRFNAARFRLLNDNYYVPLETFAAMGRTAFQGSQNISPNYSQASGLSHFFMHAKDREYRDAFIKHLTQLYSFSSRVRNNAKTLEELTGLSYAELNHQYKTYSADLQKAIDERELSLQTQSEPRSN